MMKQEYFIVEKRRIEGREERGSQKRIDMEGNKKETEKDEKERRKNKIKEKI